MNDQMRERNRSLWQYLGPAAGCLLLLGLAAAIMLDTRLVGAWRIAWFAVLIVLDLVAISWLTRHFAA
jgi:hypothetical protein